MALYQAMMSLPSGEAPDMSSLKLPPAITGAIAAKKEKASAMLTDGVSTAAEQNGGLADGQEEKRKILPPSEYHVPQGEPADLSGMEYAYWLGFIYRCESLMHEESSHMVYGAFDEAFMWKYYQQYLTRDIAQKDLAETALEICKDIDKILVTQIWMAQEI